MPWLDLEAELAEEFAGLARVDRADLRSGALRLAWWGRTTEERRDCLRPCRLCGEPIGPVELRGKGPVPEWHARCRPGEKLKRRRARGCSRCGRRPAREGMATCAGCSASSAAGNRERRLRRREAAAAAEPLAG